MQGKDTSRDDRLKAALRENLKRRKAQARARRDDHQGDPRQAKRAAEGRAAARPERDGPQEG